MFPWVGEVSYLSNAATDVRPECVTLMLALVSCSSTSIERTPFGSLPCPFHHFSAGVLAVVFVVCLRVSS